MSYCSSCGAYMPDWAEECPACGAPRAGTNKKAESASAGQSASAQAKSGEYHYTYKKAETDSSGAAGRTSSRARRDKGTYTYDGSTRADGGTYTYSGDYEPKSRTDYEREYRSDAKKNRLLAGLCYFGPLFIISLALKPKSRFVRYHANQGLLLLLTWIVVNIFDFIPFVGLMNIFGAVCFFVGIYNALKGKRKPLPVIGDITLIK